MNQPIHETIKPIVKATPERFELTWEMIETLARADVLSKGTLWAEVVGTWNLANHRNNMATALEVILQCRTFSPGVFECGENGRWRRAGENPKYDNFGGDYPDEKFLDLPRMPREQAQAVCDAINKALNSSGYAHPRYWRVVENDYVLQPGFES